MSGSQKRESKYGIGNQFTAGLVAALTPKPIDDAESEHWHAGYLAGYRLRSEKHKALNEYLVSIGHEPMAIVRIT